MKHDFIDHHRAGDSLVHTADPRLKFIVWIVYIFVVVLIPYSAKIIFLYLLFFPLLFAFVSRISLVHFLSKLAKLYPMIFFITFLLPFFPGKDSAVAHFGILNIYQAGIQKFILINAKSILAMLMSIILTATTDFTLMLKGMEGLKVPRIMINILSFMYRFIFLLIDETERMVAAFRSRYIYLPVVTRLKIVSKQIGTLFIRTFERGERVYQAMDSRGFSGKIYSINQLHWKDSDSVLLITLLAAMIVPPVVISVL